MTMQPALAERRPDRNDDGELLVKQLASLVEKNREAYDEALVEIRSAQSTFWTDRRFDSDQ
ncbi:MULTISPECIES: hypothetical protein [unclassified Mesorhizobium]|uniref:hypothetical protein n=1 Tax=unclassified Mesorhizobium TaxID=325217 RepID=UPI003014624C